MLRYWKKIDVCCTYNIKFGVTEKNNDFELKER